jgi:hypothetical protein
MLEYKPDLDALLNHDREARRRIIVAKQEEFNRAADND